jgi:CRP-like cAMP-binding protein
MSIEDDIAFLEKVPILRRVGGIALRILAIGADSIQMQAGRVLFAAGDAADGAYIIRSGSLSLKPPGADENEVIAGPGTLLGEAALLTETRRPATATALESATLMRISRAMFLKVLESDPEATRRVRELYASRANQWAREVENVRAALTRGAAPH